MVEVGIIGVSYKDTQLTVVICSVASFAESQLAVLRAQTAGEQPEVWATVLKFLQTGDMEAIPARVRLQPSRKFNPPIFPPPSRIRNQTGGRVFLFLFTDNFWRDFHNYTGKGVVFVREPKEERYGTVAVFQDLYGNLWDLIQPKT